MMTLNSDALPQCQFISQRLLSCGQMMPSDLSLLANHGYNVVINLSDYKTFQPDFNEKAAVESCGLIYYHVPVDWQQPRQTDLDRFFKIMETHRNQKTLVHCIANKRASVFVALYRMEMEGIDYEEAMRTVFEVWKPDLAWTNFILSRIHSVA